MALLLFSRYFLFSLITYREMISDLAGPNDRSVRMLYSLDKVGSKQQSVICSVIVAMVPHEDRVISIDYRGAAVCANT